MLIYTLKEIQNISFNIDSNKEIELNIDNFLKTYIQIEKTDKYEPIFSLTNKYKSFPVNSNKSTKNFFQNNKWKLNNVNVQKINQEIKLSLNKLSEKTYNNIKNEIFSLLEKNNDQDTLKNFMKELFEKIWFDEKFIELYVQLCYDIWSNENINCESKFILNLCYHEFKNKELYKKDMNENTNEEYKFINKRKIIGTIEFIGYLYIKNYIDNIQLIKIIDDLIILSKDNIDYEAFYKLWNIIIKNNRLDERTILRYKNLLTINIKNIKENRIKILIETLLDQFIIKENKNNINYINDCIIDYKKNKNLFKTVNKFKEIDKNLIINELIINELENKCNIFIEIILLLVDKKELINILDNINLDELEYDIPTIKNDFIELKKKLII